MLRAMTNEPLMRDKVRGQALSHTIDEVVLLGITAEVGERQHNDGKTRR